MTAQAKVPQEMIEASFHHSVELPPKTGMVRYEMM